MPPNLRMLIRPPEHLIIIFTNMFRVPPRISRFALQASVCCAHDPLPNIVEAVGGVVHYFWVVLAGESFLVGLCEV